MIFEKIKKYTLFHILDKHTYIARKKHFTEHKSNNPLIADGNKHLKSSFAIKNIILPFLCKNMGITEAWTGVIFLNPNLTKHKLIFWYNNWERRLTFTLAKDVKSFT